MTVVARLDDFRPAHPGELSLQQTRTVGVLEREARDRGIDIGRRLTRASIAADPIDALDLAASALAGMNDGRGASAATMRLLDRLRGYVRDDLSAGSAA